MVDEEAYRLQALLEIRARGKAEAERNLGACMQSLEAERARRREMEVMLARMRAKRLARVREYAEKTMRGEMSARDAVSARLFLERLGREEQAQHNALCDQEAVVVRKESELHRARRELVEASRELEALEKHRARWAEQAEKARSAKQEEALDELAQSLFLSRNSGRGS